MKRYGIICILLSVISLPSFAEYRLNSTQSTLNFISVKNAAVTEVHSFLQLSGELNDKGGVKVVIELASLETHIPIRNERMKSMLFDTSAFAQANVAGQVDIAELQALKTGESMVKTLAVDLSLHGKRKVFEVDVSIVALGQGGYQVSSVKPVVLNLADFDLLPGVQALQDIANLNSIAVQVPVTFHLVFEKS